MDPQGQLSELEIEMMTDLYNRWYIYYNYNIELFMYHKSHKTFELEFKHIGNTYSIGQ